MSFAVSISDDSLYPVITLTDNAHNTTAEIYAFGGLLNSFSKDHQGKPFNVVDGFVSVEDCLAHITKGFNSAKLSPFACRVHNARYHFGESDYQLSKYNVNNSALHGLLYDQVFSVIETAATDEFARVNLQFVYDLPNEGYPFVYRCEVEYCLKTDHTLCIKTIITNIDNQLIPIIDGWHPYFTLGDKIDDCQLEFQSKEILDFTSELIPNGKKHPYQEFGSIKQLGDTHLDNCFTVNRAECQPMVVFRNPKKNIQIEIHPGTGYPFLQIFTPPHRNSIAIENLSAAPDAFNNFIGLHVLEPKETISFSTKFVIKSL